MILSVIVSSKCVLWCQLYLKMFGLLKKLKYWFAYPLEGISQ